MNEEFIISIDDPNAKEVYGDFMNEEIQKHVILNAHLKEKKHQK